MGGSGADDQRRAGSGKPQYGNSGTPVQTGEAPQARYNRSLEQIRRTKEYGKRTKSGIMLGLGESREEVHKSMDDLVAHGCDVLTLGQYLQPTRMHLDVKAFVTPDEFEAYKEEGLRRGFLYVESGPLVRSSYHAERHLI